jgi:hypothetical protein
MRSAERSTDVSLATTVARLVGAIEWRPSRPSIRDAAHLWQSTEPLSSTCARLVGAAGRHSGGLGRVVER